jgi:hypothetical protein
VDEQDRDPARPRDVGASQRSRAGSLCLCIVTRNRLRSSEFVECLEESLDPDDEIQFVLDRRQPRSGTGARPDTTDSPSQDRRHHHLVDIALRIHGFALVVPPTIDPLRMGRSHVDVPRRRQTGLLGAILARLRGRSSSEEEAHASRLRQDVPVERSPTARSR